MVKHIHVPIPNQKSGICQLARGGGGEKQALVAVIQEASSHRGVDAPGRRIAQASICCKEIDERVKAFLERPLGGDWPHLWLDATYLKVREGGRVRLGRPGNR